MVVTTIDTISAQRGEPIVVKIGSPVTKAIVNTSSDTQQVSLSDTYQVVPYSKRVTTDFTIPASVQADLTRVDQALLNEISDREIAIVEAVDVSKTYTDGVESQLLTNIAASYISNAEGANYILKSEATQLSLEYNTATGTTLASLQDLYNTGVAVGNAQATFSTDVTAIADSTTALASRTTALEASVAGVEAGIYSTETVLVDGVNWTVGTSKIAKGPNGEITGWGFGDGSALNSYFTVNADRFQILGSTTGYSPFAIDTTTGKIKFTGDVRFEGLGLDGGSTTINGGLLAANTVSGDTIIGGTVISAPLIDGGTINGVNINGSIIKGSWIDYLTTGGLSNWQFYTPASPPAIEYRDNFAKDNITGDLVVDSQGYYRLPKVKPFTSLAVTQLNSKMGGSFSSTYTNEYWDLYAWDDYTVDTMNRCQTNPQAVNTFGVPDISNGLQDAMPWRSDFESTTYPFIPASEYGYSILGRAIIVQGNYIASTCTIDSSFRVFNNLYRVVGTLNSSGFVSLTGYKNGVPVVSIPTSGIPYWIEYFSLHGLSFCVQLGGLGGAPTDLPSNGGLAIILQVGVDWSSSNLENLTDIPTGTNGKLGWVSSTVTISGYEGVQTSWEPATQHRTAIPLIKEI